MNTLYIVRTLLGKTTSELGNDLGVSRMTIYCVEHGKSAFRRVYKLALLYLIDTQYKGEVPQVQLKLARKFILKSLEEESR